MKFTGPDYVPAIDHDALAQQINRIKNIMSDCKWRTHKEIADLTGAPPQSVSSQLRNLRMKENGGYIVERRHRGERKSRLNEYRLIDPTRDRVYLEAEVQRRQSICNEAKARFYHAEEELSLVVKRLENYDKDCV